MSTRIALTLGLLASLWAAQVAAQVTAPSVAAAADSAELRCVKPVEGKPRPRGPAASAPGVTIYVNCGAASASASSNAAGAASSSASSAASSAAGASGVAGAGSASQPASGAASAAVPDLAGSAPRGAFAVDPSDLRWLRLALLWTLGALALLLALYGIGSLLGALELRPLGWMMSGTRAYLRLFMRSSGPGTGPPVPPRAMPADLTFRRHWGSFGGESTGWNMSGPLARLLAGLAMIAIALWVLLQLLAIATEPKPAASTTAAAPADGPQKTTAKTATTAPAAAAR